MLFLFAYKARSIMKEKGGFIMIELIFFLFILTLGFIALLGLFYGIAKGIVKLIWSILK